MAEDNQYNIELGISADATSANSSFGTLAVTISQIRQDMEAIQTAQAGMTERADGMREYFEGVLGTVEKIRDALGQMSLSEAVFSSDIRNNMLLLNENISAVRAMGGSISDLRSPMYTNPAGQYGAGAGPTGGVNISPVPNTVAANAAWISSRRRNSAYGPPPGARLGGVDDGDLYAPSTKGDTSDWTGDFFARPPSLGSGVSPALLEDIDKYPALKQRLESQGLDLGSGKNVNRVASMSYNDLMGNIDTLSSAIPMGGAIGSRIKNIISGYGITPEAIASSEKTGWQQSGVDEYGQPQYSRTQGIPTGVEQSAMTLANAVARIVDSKFASTVMKGAGYASMAANAYGIPADIAAQVRQYTNVGQAQGNVFGTVDYSRSLGMGIQSFLHSDLNLNPFYSSADYQNAMLQGASMGLRGSQLTNYADIAMKAKTQWGMSAQGTASLVAGGLGLGVTADQNLNTYAQVRQITAGTDTSTAYGLQAYTAGMQNAGLYGGLTGNAAAVAGVNAVNFGANNLQLQAAGFTGMEGVGSTIQNALMAQSMGVSYQNLFSATRNMSGAAYSSAVNMSQEKIIQMAGINTKMHYSSQSDFFNKNSGRAMVLQMLLSSMAQNGDPGLAGAAASPKRALLWAWGIVRQRQSMNQKPGSFLSHILDDVRGAASRTIDDIGHDVRNVVDAPGSLVGNVAHGLVTAAAYAGGTFEGESLSQMRQTAHNWNHGYDETVGMAIQPGKPISNLAAIFSRAVTNKRTWSSEGQSTAGLDYTGQSNSKFNQVSVQVSIHPHAKGLITAAVKQGSKGFDSGGVSPNVQPTRTDFAK